ATTESAEPTVATAGRFVRAGRSATAGRFLRTGWSAAAGRSATAGTAPTATRRIGRSERRLARMAATGAPEDTPRIVSFGVGTQLAVPSAVSVWGNGVRSGELLTSENSHSPDVPRSNDVDSKPVETTAADHREIVRVDVTGRCAAPVRYFVASTPPFWEGASRGHSYSQPVREESRSVGSPAATRCRRGGGRRIAAAARIPPRRHGSAHRVRRRRCRDGSATCRHVAGSAG